MLIKTKKKKPSTVNITHQEQNATGKTKDILLLLRKIKSTQQIDAVHKCANAATQSKMEDGTSVLCLRSLTYKYSEDYRYYEKVPCG